jgi:hypothetical protein
MSGMEGLFFLKYVGMKLDIKKAILLFASIHLLIAMVAERKDKMKIKSTSNRPAATDGELANAKTAMIAKFPFGIFRHP